MSRVRFFASFAALGAGVAASAGLVGVASLVWLACSDPELASSAASDDASTSRRDASPVDPGEAGASLDATLAISASCDKYCELVTSNCTDENRQYDSAEQCRAFCEHLPLTSTARKDEQTSGATVSCRQYWADTPARTSPKDYCLAAGPFGGNVCGDRCTAFCGVVLSTCAPDGGGPVVYPALPECATACAGFAYADAGADGGGEGPDGPDAGNTLNCRLYHLRLAVENHEACSALVPEGGACE